MKRLQLPLTKSDVKKLKVGDKVLISGTMFTVRDRAHRFLTKENVPKKLKEKLKGAVIYHCGPIMRKIPAGKAGKKKWLAVSAGPTTSKRMEMYTPDLLKQYGVKMIIGKDGLLGEGHKALVKHGAVYCSIVGGIGALAAESIVAVKNVHMLKEFGIAEAIWEFEVKDLPCMVTMDSHGSCLIYDIFQRAKKKLEQS